MSLRASTATAAVVAVLSACVWVVLSLGLTAAPASAGEESELLTMRDDRITESSGLVASLQHPGVYWTHNDSGDQPRLFAVGSDGETKAVLTLQGVTPRDWEALALGRGANDTTALFIGDIGDNQNSWPEVWIYRVPEPAQLGDATVEPVRYRVTYADGPRNAEALLIDPRRNKLYIATKEDDGGLYEQPAKLTTSGVNIFTRVAAAPGTVTDGAFAPDGSRFVLRGYLGATMFSAPGQVVGEVPTPLQLQGESVAFTPDGGALLFGSEGSHSSVRRVVLEGANRPDSVVAREAAASQPVTKGAGDQEGDSGRPKTTAYGPGFLAVFLMVLTVYGYLKFRRRSKSRSE
ncbi:MAG TPA: hypothetical protein VLH10_15185 [Yinghuangia sp.]|nr:hypothetical protein [Yinghuangia sp.]